MKIDPAFFIVLTAVGVVTAGVGIVMLSKWRLW